MLRPRVACEPLDLWAVSSASDLGDDFWAFHRDTAQSWNIDRGDVDHVARWEDYSSAGVAARVERLIGFVDRAAVESSGELTERDSVLAAAVAFGAGATAALLPFERDIGLVAGPLGIATLVTVLVPGYSLVTAEHGDGYVTKMRTLPAFVSAWTDGLRDGLSVGRVATARGISGTIAALDALLARKLSDDPLLGQEPPTELSPREVADWRERVAVAVRDDARPALAAVAALLRDEVLPAGRSDNDAGICHVPGGVEAYRALLWASTSTDLLPDDVHAVGLEQLALLDDEYRSLGPEACGLAEPAAVRERLRSDQSLRYESADEIVADATATLARAESEAWRWFARLPEAQCVPVAVAAGPMAYYTAPSPDGIRPGTFFYNTANPSAWTRYQLEPVTFHETVPGHHLQLALAQEANLHPVLGELEVTSYSEGWGLYAERLADEMSLYSSPLQRMGVLTLDSLRAARLVVDTGIHDMGWTRHQAIDFLVANTAQDHSNAEREIDRYIATPGQATSYMIGRLEIQRIRRDAERALGSGFAIRDFHHTVLANGMTPLDQLDRTVQQWARRLAPAPPS